MAIHLTVLSWALIFILRLRFPPGKSIAKVITQRYDKSTLVAFRKFQRLYKKLGKAKLDLLFLQSCKNRNVIPKFLWFKVANRALKRSLAYFECQRKLLNEEIAQKQCLIRSLTNKSESAYSDLSTKVRTIDLIHLKSVSDKENTKVIEKHQRIQEKKLLRLCSNSSQTTTLNPDDVIFNYSNRNLTPEEKQLLVKGLNFSLPPNKLKYVDYLVPFEFLHRKLKNEPISTASNYSEDHIKTRLKDIALSSYRNYSPPNFLLTRDDYAVLKKLKDDESIHIMKPDKGNGVVIVNKTEYFEKMEQILNESSKFDKVSSDPLKETFKREKQLRNFLLNLKKQNVISDTIYERLAPTGSKPGILYGLPKVHKTNLPFRPILSAIGTHSYNLSKFLLSLLSPLLTNRYLLPDTFSFLDELRNSDLDSDNVFMASFDINSLFTNVPLEETIDIIINKAFNNATLFHDFSLTDFRKLLDYSVKDTHFLFNSRYYKQKDGVSMGSPLGPFFANIFLEFHEGTWLSNCPKEFKPLFYRRYIDDCFIVFRSSSHVPLFLNYLNSQHTNISFTCEIENDGKLPFLDILIERTTHGFSTSVYRKPTFTGLFTNFDSFIPFSFKRGLIYTLLDRYFKICSSYYLFHAEVVKLKTFLINNGYPKNFLDRCTCSFLNRIFAPTNTNTNTDTTNKNSIYFSIPFTGKHALQLRTQLTKLCSSAFPHLSLRIIFRSGRRLSDFFPFKDVIPKSLRSRVVYKFTCQCGALYVGQTRRHFHTRVSEHLGISPLTGKKCKTAPASSIHEHCNDTGHSVSYDNFSILSSSRSSSKLELLVRESLFISQLQPALNENIPSAPLSLF